MPLIMPGPLRIACAMLFFAQIVCADEHQHSLGIMVKKFQCKIRARAQLKAKYPFYNAGRQRFARAEEGVGLLRPLPGIGVQHGGSRSGQRDSTYDVNFKVTFLLMVFFQSKALSEEGGSQVLLYTL